MKPYLTVEDEQTEERMQLVLKTDPVKLERHKALLGYLSTPKLIKTLTDISHAIIPVVDRKAYLKEALTAINRKLPASVYIPFVNSSIRNYAILHIVIDEARVFQTKERAPLLLCIEAYRPEELQLVKEERAQNNNYL